MNKNKPNYGFVAPEIKPEDYVFGAFGVTDAPILAPDRNWIKFRPAKEVQRNQKFDTYNCTGYATNNQVETLMKRLYGRDFDYSDRATGVVAGTYPPGNNPHKVLEAVRKYGFTEELDLPFSDDLETVDEYYSAKPIGRDKLESFLADWKKKWVLKHDWVFTSGSIDFKCKAIWDALQYSPVAVSVRAWKIRNDKYYKNKGEQDNHWTLIVGGKEGEYWEVFDSYDQTLKSLEWKYDFGFAKRITITTVAEEESLMKSLQDQLNKIKEALQVIALRIQEMLNPPKPIVEEKAQDKESLARAIAKYENVNKALNNPGGLRWSPFQSGSIIQKKTGKSLATFDSYADGWKALIHQINIVCNGTSPAYNEVAKKRRLENCGELYVNEFIEIYSPPIENDTDSYIDYVLERVKNVKMKELA